MRIGLISPKSKDIRKHWNRSLLVWLCITKYTEVNYWNINKFTHLSNRKQRILEQATNDAESSLVFFQLHLVVGLFVLILIVRLGLGKCVGKQTFCKLSTVADSGTGIRGYGISMGLLDTTISSWSSFDHFDQLTSCWHFGWYLVQTFWLYAKHRPHWLVRVSVAHITPGHFVMCHLDMANS